MDQAKLTCKRTRIAPTPSGFLHVGNVLSFALTAALARRTDAQILLRIDDMDQERVSGEYVQDIFDTLNFLEIPWEEGPRNYTQFENEYSQLHRLPLYNNALSQLQEQEAVFACTCSRSQILSINAAGNYPGTCRDKHIPLDTKGACWRLKTDHPFVTLNTISGEETNVVLPDSMKNFIVRKKDGYPAYQLTSLADDLFFEVDMVVRGEDLWPSTLAQHYLAAVLEQPAFRNVHFFHHALLSGEDGQKFSKSVGSTAIRMLRKEGKTPAGIYAMIAGLMDLPATVHDWQSLAASLGI